jgi:hypothetical protein
VSRNTRAFIELAQAGPSRSLRAYRIARRACTLRAVQKIREFAPFLAFLLGRELRAVVEIGADQGGTFYAWCQVATTDALIVGIDLPGGEGGQFTENIAATMGSYKRLSQRAETILGDSHDPATKAKLERILEGRPIDLLFIDGDHSYQGVKQDFEMYAPLANLVALHDVLPHPDFPACQVDQLWAEIKGTHRTREFLDPEDNRGWGQWGGIGVVLDA